MHRIYESRIHIAYSITVTGHKNSAPFSTYYINFGIATGIYRALLGSIAVSFMLWLFQIGFLEVSHLVEVLGDWKSN